MANPENATIFGVKLKAENISYRSWQKRLNVTGKVGGMTRAKTQRQKNFGGMVFGGWHHETTYFTRISAWWNGTLD